MIITIHTNNITGGTTSLTWYQLLHENVIHGATRPSAKGNWKYPYRLLRNPLGLWAGSSNQSTDLYDEQDVESSGIPWCLHAFRFCLVLTWGGTWTRGCPLAPPRKLFFSLIPGRKRSLWAWRKRIETHTLLVKSFRTPQFSSLLLKVMQFNVSLHS